MALNNTTDIVTVFHSFNTTPRTGINLSALVVPQVFQCCLRSAIRSASPISSFQELEAAANPCRGSLGYDSISDVDFLRIAFQTGLQKREGGVDKCHDWNIANDPLCLEAPRPWYIAYMCLWVVLLVVAAAGNGLVCVLYKSSFRLKKEITNMFIVSLAASDLCICVFIIPIRFKNTLHNHNFCALLQTCQLYFTTDILFFVASMINLLMITCDRFVAVVFPYRYRGIVTPASAKRSIAIVWLLAGIWGAMVHFDINALNFSAVTVKDMRCTRVHDNFFPVLFALAVYLPVVLIAVMYITILCVLFKEAQDVRSTRICKKNQELKWQNRLVQTLRVFAERRAEFQAAKLVLLVVGVFIICWLPGMIIFNIQFLCPDCIAPSYVLYSIFSEILPVFNSTCNPFIYAIFHDDFKKAFRSMMRNRQCQLFAPGAPDMRNSSAKRCQEQSSDRTIQRPICIKKDVVRNTSQTNSKSDTAVANEVLV